MSTHVNNCIVCETEVACCDDNSALGLTGCGPDTAPPFAKPISICSRACFEAVERALRERREFIEGSVEYAYLLEG